MKPKAVLAYCREKEIKSFDLRFADIDGHWRHVTLPVSALAESSFEEGFGFDVALHHRDPSGWIGNAVLVPQCHANYLEPFTNQPTLVFIASVQDGLLRQEVPYDPRFVASQALAHLESSGIGDSVLLRTEYQFSLGDVEVESNARVSDESDYLACGLDDQDFIFRCDAVHLALESGLQVDRHYRGHNASSVISLRAANMIAVCDDLMMIRYLVSQFANKNNMSVHSDRHWLPTQWDIRRDGESIFSGSSHRGMSDVGLHAIGGILKHAGTIAAIAYAPHVRFNATIDYPWLKTCSPTIAQSICSIAIAANNPRSRTIEFRGTPATSNPYLVFSAVLLAMIDGIQNKTSPSSGFDARAGVDVHPYWIDGTHPGKVERPVLFDHLKSDRDFLLQGDVFSESLLNVLGESQPEA